MLHTALHSINSQRNKEAIASILVIENGLNNESRAVCSKFPDLPITYVFRDNPLPVGYPSLVDATSYVKTDYLAILFDDDWWFPHHLDAVLSSMAGRRDVVAGYGGSIWTRGEMAKYEEVFGQSNITFATAGSGNAFDVSISLEEMILANLPSTCLHLSSLIVRSETWRSALEVINDGNPYDVDRLLAVRFCEYGRVILKRYPTVAIRRHGGQESARLDNPEGRRWWDSTNQKILRIANAQGIKVETAFRKHLDQHPELLPLLEVCLDSASRKLLIDLGVSFESAKSAVTPSNVGARHYAKQLMPPILWALLCRLRLAFQKSGR